MNTWLVTTLLTISLLGACSMHGVAGSPEDVAAKNTLTTSIGSATCTRKIDDDDPNESTYLLCPGMADYALIVRQVGAGRHSIDVVSPNGELHPLDYPLYITRGMFELDEQAEWRMAADASGTPAALVVRVLAHDSEEDPAIITHAYLAVAKITADSICVSGRIPLAQTDAAELAAYVEAATKSACLQPLPPLGGQ